jgi:ABC-type multidrug transport system permease subunit
MMTKQFIELVRCRWREFLREPSAFFWVVFMPLLWMLALGYAFPAGRMADFTVGVLTSDSKFYELSNDRIRIQVVGNLEIAQKLLRYGQIDLLWQGSQEEPTFTINPNEEKSEFASLFLEKTLMNRLESQEKKSTLKIKHTLMDSVGTRYIDLLVPGLLAISLMSTSLFGLAMTLVSNRRENLLKRYLTTPMSKTSFLVSHGVGRLIILCFEFCAVVGVGKLLFGVSIKSGIISYFLASCLIALCFTSFAIFIGARTKSIPAVAAGINLFMIPSILLSNVFFSITNFPPWLQKFSSFLPLSESVRLLRELSLEPALARNLTEAIALLLTYTLIFSFFARKRFTWY